MTQPPTFSEYVLAPLHPPVRDLRPDIQEACRQALLDAGVPVQSEGDGPAPREESWLVAMLVISMCVVGAVMLLWLVGGVR